MAATRQDLQGIVDYAKNTILGQTVSRGQLQAVAEQLRLMILQNLNELHLENRQAMQQSQAQRQMLANRVMGMEQDVKTLQQTLSRILDQQTRAMSILQRL